MRRNSLNGTSHASDVSYGIGSLSVPRVAVIFFLMSLTITGCFFKKTNFEKPIKLESEKVYEFSFEATHEGYYEIGLEFTANSREEKDRLIKVLKGPSTDGNGVFYPSIPILIEVIISNSSSSNIVFTKKYSGFNGHNGYTLEKIYKIIDDDSIYLNNGDYLLKINLRSTHKELEKYSPVFYIIKSTYK